MIKTSNVKQTRIEYTDISDKLRYVTVTEWGNGEGYDISFNDEHIIPVSHEDFKALTAIINYMEIS